MSGSLRSSRKAGAPRILEIPLPCFDFLESFLRVILGAPEGS